MPRVLRAVPIALLLLSLASLLAPRRATTVPLYAARTGLMCQSCHFDPNGGGARNEFGFAFARNRHSLTPEDSTSAWKDLELVNRIGDTMPVYIGINERLMLLADSRVQSDSLDVLGFFNMESALSITFQPHSKLALVFTRDGFNSSSRTKDVFGVISGLPLEGYLKAGRFRTPFGLRMDDHTVATRNAFLDPTFGASTFMPYDTREPDVGIELGAAHGPVFGRISFTNGPSTDPSFGPNTFAETKALKLGYNMPWYQGGLSFFDNFNKVPGSLKRSTRWGYYGLTHAGPFALLGEIAAGTDEGAPIVPGLASGPKTNLLAGWAELDYAPTRWVNFRARYDRLERDRSSDAVVRDLNSFSRYALEGEVVPVPFAEVRWTLRLIDPVAPADPLGTKIENEKQAYVQMHFSY